MDALRRDLRAPTRWPALDGIRGLAVIAVVLYHAVRLLVIGGQDSASTFSPAWWPAATGRLALDAFFVLSGFLIVESWRSIRRRSDGLVAAVRDYAGRRAARILPAYWVSLVVLVPLLAPHLFRSPGDLALLAGVQQYLRPDLPSEVNVVYWSLTTEVHFYVLAPLMAIGLAKVGAKRMVSVCLILAVAWQIWVPGGLPKSLILGRVDQFALGAAVAGMVHAWEQGRRSPIVSAVQRRGVGLVLVALFLALGAWQGAVLDGYGTALASLMHPLVGLVLAALFLRVLTAPGSSFLEHRWLRLAGLVSYGVYLFHYPVLRHGFALVGLSSDQPSPLFVAVTATVVLTAVSFVVGTSSYLLIERPFLRRKAARPAGSADRAASDANLAPWPITATSMTSYASSASATSVPARASSSSSAR